MNRPHNPSESSKRCVGVALGILLLGLAPSVRGAVAETTKKAYASVKKERDSVSSYYTVELGKLGAQASKAKTPAARAQKAKELAALKKKRDKAVADYDKHLADIKRYEGEVYRDEIVVFRDLKGAIQHVRPKRWNNLFQELPDGGVGIRKGNRIVRIQDFHPVTDNNTGNVYLMRDHDMPMVAQGKLTPFRLPTKDDKVLANQVTLTIRRGKGTVTGTIYLKVKLVSMGKLMAPEGQAGTPFISESTTRLTGKCTEKDGKLTMRGTTNMKTSLSLGGQGHQNATKTGTWAAWTDKDGKIVGYFQNKNEKAKSPFKLTL